MTSISVKVIEAVCFTINCLVKKLIFILFDVVFFLF